MFVSANAIGIVLLVTGAVFAAEPTRPVTEIDYLKQIKPIFKKNCFACHGVLQQRSGLRTDTAAFYQKGEPAVPPSNRARVPTAS